MRNQMSILRKWLDRKDISYSEISWGISFLAFGRYCNVWEHPYGGLCYSAFDKDGNA